MSNEKNSKGLFKTTTIETLKRLVNPINVVFYILFFVLYSYIKDGFPASACVAFIYPVVASKKIIDKEWDYIIPTGKHLWEICSIVIFGYVAYFVLRPFV